MLPHIIHYRDKVEYRYKLIGFEKEWSVFSKETKKEYTNLPEGDYEFRVQARNLYGVLSKEAVYSFTVLPPWYRTWWAYLLYAVFLGGFIWGITWMNTRRLIEQKKLLEEKVNLRTAQLQEANVEITKEKERVEDANVQIQQQKHLIEEKHKEVTDSIHYASRIQRAMLTSEEYITRHLQAEYFIFYQPKDIVSGDFYWARSIKAVFI